MNTKLIKIIAAASCGATALGLSFRPQPAHVDLAKNAQSVAPGSKVIVISNPESPDSYGIGTYRVEGILLRNTKLTLALDGKEVKSLTTNSEDGQYDVDVDVKEPGKHELLITYKNSKGKSVSQKLEFKSSDKKMTDEVAQSDEHSDDNNETGDSNESNVEKEPKSPPHKDEDDKNEETQSSTLLPDEPIASDDPNSEANRKASGVHDKKVDPKPPTKPIVKPATKPTTKKSATTPKAKGMFVLSSHTNFNVVPHGIIKIGGKGNPGDKIMLLVDNKPSMRGTVKPDGRWSFPVKIANPGFRRITAQNLKSREAKTVKLKIK